MVVPWVNVVVFLMSPCVGASPASAPLEDGRLARYVARNLARQTKFNFLGHVQDMQGSSVPGASVTMNLAEYLPPQTPADHGGRLRFSSITKITDANGDFELTDLVGVNLAYGDVEKEGYSSEVSPQTGQVQFSGRELSASKERYVFRVRKQSRGTFVCEDLGRDVAYPGEQKCVGLNFFDPGHRASFPVDETKSGELGGLCDLAYVAEFLPKSSEYLVTFKAVDGGGVQQLTKRLDEAPSDGYLPESTARIPVGKSIDTVILYVKSRKHPVYTVMELDLSADDRRLSISWSSTSNPFGDRNLVLEPSFKGAAEVYCQLDKDVRTTIAKSGWAIEPDIKGRIVAAKSKHIGRPVPGLYIGTRPADTRPADTRPASTRPGR